MRKLLILAVPLNAVGHVNACSGALRALLDRGHRVVFLIEEAFRGKLSALGYEECVYTVSKPSDLANPGELLSKRLLDGKLMSDNSSLEKLKIALSIFHGDANYEELEIWDRAVAQAMKHYKPDLIFYDGSFSLLPSIYYSNIPWIKCISTAPLGQIFGTNKVPPAFSGYPSNGNLKEYDRFNEIRQEFCTSKSYSDLMVKMGYKSFPGDFLYPETQAMTVYAYPEEINYDYLRSQGWFNLEVFTVPEHVNDVSRIEKLVKDAFNDGQSKSSSSKLIYLSMGSMGSINLQLMKRLVAILGETPHRYIVSKGPRHAEFDLPPNMFGGRYVPQTEILPLVDLVITHGGNNTVTESFAHGKPMIVMPLLTDQFDNAQRIDETGYGARLNPFRFTLEEINEVMNRLMQNRELEDKLEIAAQRIQMLNRHEQLADRIEHFFV